MRPALAELNLARPGMRLAVSIAVDSVGKMPDSERDNERESPRGEPSAANSETAKPEQAIEDNLVDGRSNHAVYGSEGSGGDTSPARPRERKRRT
jgi:hypothetical protein